MDQDRYEATGFVYRLIERFGRELAPAFLIERVQHRRPLDRRARRRESVRPLDRRGGAVRRRAGHGRRRGRCTAR